MGREQVVERWEGWECVSGEGVGVGVRCGEDGLHPAAQTGPTE